MLMRYPALVLGLLILIGILGCASMSVTTDYDQDVDFAEYKTFDWIKQKSEVPPRRAFDASLFDKRLRSAVEAELAAKGYERVTTGKPDLLIAYHIGARNQVDVTTHGYRYGPRGRWVGRHVEVHRYKEGTLILDLVDAGMKQLVWRGTAVGAVYNPNDMEAGILEAVTDLFEEFPPE
jgi:hypothetical protein